jgi:DNA-binding NtrC family response regulator
MGATTARAPKKRHRILLLENDLKARRMILDTLKKTGYIAMEAADSDQAATLLGFNDPPAVASVILCDIRAAKIKGIEAAAYFRARYPHIPVVVTAAYPDIEWAITLMKRGVTDYLVKPISQDDLLIVLQNAIDHYVMVNRGSF